MNFERLKGGESALLEFRSRCVEHFRGQYDKMRIRKNFYGVKNV